METKLYDLIDDEIIMRNRGIGSNNKIIIDYILEKYMHKFKVCESDKKFIAEVSLNRIIKYRESHSDDSYNKTIGLRLYREISNVVTQIRKFKSSYFGLGKYIFKLFKRWIIE